MEAGQGMSSCLDLAPIKSHSVMESLAPEIYFLLMHQIINQIPLLHFIFFFPLNILCWFQIRTILKIFP